jgi:cobalt-zinc-cadmium efflux system outer membrane protein
MKWGYAAAVFLAGVPLAGAAAFEPTPAPLPFRQYLQAVARGNLDLAAQRFNVSIAEAQIEVARIFPDPQLTGGLGSVDVSGQGSPTAVNLGLSQTIELGGKRGARISAAQFDHAGAQATLEDFFRTLRGEATDAFIESLHTRLVLTRKELTMKSLSRLVAVNEQRLRVGDIGEVALIQSRVEARKFQGEFFVASGEVKNADLALTLQLGVMPAGGPPTPTGELRLATRTFDAQALISSAQKTRPDVVARRRTLDATRARVGLAKANRWIDPTLGLFYSHNFPAGTLVFGTPDYDTLGASLTLPVPFSHVYRGELHAAGFAQTQAECQLRAAELKVEVDIRQALAKYQASLDRLKLYNSGLLTDAERVHEATLYNYSRGGATLLEVLEAQRTVDEVFLAYYDALADHAHGLVALELAAGTWDVDF